ncbi:ATP-grasp domain-containing protein [Corallococcus sp. CA047B]|uniref:ATP-grasp domain-containing protein n=1 Tax=Corallococcus sp. CA047B TaxID=2316729 RepID=UPI000EA12C56|nr:ATP-grasp domain-containing protein [Corallococcus sp. CA047B]RKH13217.1 ATP-grasp domain-containing protein [Corallococcus sp. CA047B]
MRRERLPEPESRAPVAVLFQALPPPVIDGVRKPAKAGGYADSGADIAYALREAGVPVVTPVANPDPAVQEDWVFGDDAAGIAAARDAGARVLWANTVLFTGHPLEAVLKDVWVVGQDPRTQETFDDKWVTNEALRRAGHPVAASVLVSAQAASGRLGLDTLTEAELEARDLRFPLVLKPMRGRGSQGVVRVMDMAQLKETAARLLAAREQGVPRFGDTLILEQYLGGEELTVTVMPPARFVLGGVPHDYAHHWSLPPVRRFHHQDGVAPYSGAVAVVDNSEVLGLAARQEPRVRAALERCALAAGLLGVTAPIRIDCRSDALGTFRLFDLNLKPNMTGPGRPGRERQDSLVSLSAQAFGWSYRDLLLHLLAQAWRLRRSG